MDHAPMMTVRHLPVGSPTLTGVRVTGDLRGLAFDAQVEQRFRNNTAEHLEVVYTLPLPHGAVLLGVEVVLGGKRLTGAVVEKRAAEAGYKEAIAHGDAAIMLERNRDLSYTLNLGNLAPSEDCVVTLRYAQTLREEGGQACICASIMTPGSDPRLRMADPRPCRTPRSHPTRRALAVGADGSLRRRVRVALRCVASQPVVLCGLRCGDLHMATNLSIDPELLDRALEVSGERTKKAAVTLALQEFIARRGQKRLVELMGKLEWDTSFDYKAERSRE